MSDKEDFDRYLLALRETAVEEKTEHTDRAALQSLLRAVAASCDATIGVQHEPKRVIDKGAPDFKVIRGGLILGYVENKAIGENLDRVLKSEQIKRYKSLSQNIVFPIRPDPTPARTTIDSSCPASCRASTSSKCKTNKPWMPTDQVRGLKAHGSSPAMTLVERSGFSRGLPVAVCLPARNGA